MVFVNAHHFFYQASSILCSHTIMILAAGHVADALIANNWTVLSVRRLMTTIGLIGPGIFMVFFSSVNNIVLALM